MASPDISSSDPSHIKHESPDPPAPGPDPSAPSSHLANDLTALDFQLKARLYLAEQTEHVVMPSFAKWFDLGAIHSIEENLFPDFFSPAARALKSPYKTTQVYINMRNFIVNAYRLNPREYLTVTAVRRNLAGDVTTIIRVHQFLERWGIINYQIDPKTKSAIVGPQYTGHFQITLDTPTGLVPFVPEKSVKDSFQAPTLKLTSESADVDQGLNLHIRRNIYLTVPDSGAKKPQSVVQFFCSICGRDATTIRYHNLRIKSYTHNPSSTINNASILCSVCYDQGLFPLNFSSSDFVKLRKAQEALEWTEQETLLLLEGIEMFGTFDASASSSINVNFSEQWDKIADYVASKNREQCLTRFIQLPIEDKYLQKIFRSQENEQSPAPSASSPESLVSDIVSRIMQEPTGPDMVRSKAEQQASEAATEQQALISKIMALTLEKVNHKLQRIDALSKDLRTAEHQLQCERKQVLYERWAQLERVQRLKKERPDLASVLDELIVPVSVPAADKALTLAQDDSRMDIEPSEDAAAIADKEKLPVSVLKPKEYQFWLG